ncbi:HdeD family acid-resistance protein [Caenispirillum salinarum]|uniref:HdeD family acid-resistance protein n=1 Tax=Caenispirillum salinarum TaxID=859058 RepID=UPI00384D810D
MAINTSEPDLAHVSRQAVRENSGWFIGIGALWVILGALAIVAPLAAGIALNLVLGVVFLIGGGAQLVQAFRVKGWKGTSYYMVGALLALALGVILLVFPGQGLAALTLVLAAFFLVNGIVKLAAGARYRDIEGWGWLMVSGVLSLIIGVLIFVGWPASALWAVGILVGIELIFAGIWMIAAGSAARGAVK